MMRKIVLRHEWLIGAGFLIGVLSLLNFFSVTNLDSDLFWTIAGLALALEQIFEWYAESQEEKLLLEVTGEDKLSELARLMNEDPMGGTVTIVHSQVGHTMPFVTLRSALIAQYKKENLESEPETE